MLTTKYEKYSAQHRRAKFEKFSALRLQQATSAIDRLAKLSDPAYQWDPKEITKIARDLKASANKALAAFKSRRAWKTSYRDRTAARIRAAAVECGNAIAGGQGSEKVIDAVVKYGLAMIDGYVLYKSDEEFDDEGFDQWIKDEKLDQVKPFDDPNERDGAMVLACHLIPPPYDY